MKLFCNAVFELWKLSSNYLTHYRKDNLHTEEYPCEIESKDIRISHQYILFQAFDQEKYKFMQFPEIQNNNTATDISKDSDNKNMKTSLSLAGLRIDERGGIYLNPLLDTHSAYFK